MNHNQYNVYDFIGNPMPPHSVLDLNGFTPGYAHPDLRNGPVALHPGTGILPIDEIPLFAGFDFPFEAELSTPTGSRPGKPRRRRTADGDVIKHRRTRNGCYTCRGRRIKCDEGRPTCERCKKGSRDCIYPDAPPPKSKSKSPKDPSKSPKSLKSPRSPGDEEDDDDDFMVVDKEDPDESAISIDGMYETEGSQNIKEESPASTVSHLNVQRKERTHKVAIAADSKSEDPGSQSRRKRDRSARKLNLEQSTVQHGSPVSSQETTAPTERSSDNGSPLGPSTTPNDTHAYSQLLPELRDLMRYHHAHLGYHHYFFRQDATQFVKDLLPTAAISYEPLLYAVCTFAAYHRAIAQDGAIEDFLGYYQKAVSLLLQSLKSGQNHTESTLMTMLQLATFEEYLGDWVNLIGHLGAAKELVHEFYTPSSMVTTETRRKIFSWYSRFDIFAGMASGHQPSLDITWFRAMERWHFAARAMDPSSVDLQVRWLASYKRVIASALTEITSKVVSGKLAKDDFAKQYSDLMQQVAAWGNHLVPLIEHAEAAEDLPELHVLRPIGKAESEGASASGVDESCWPPGLMRATSLYLGSAWILNLMIIDLYSTTSLQRISYGRIMQDNRGAAEAQALLREECRMIEAMTTSSSAPEGSVLCCQSQLAVLGMFLKDNSEDIDWCRYKLAELENLGYFFPPTFRQRVSDTWNDPSVRDWWLPNGEGHRPIIKALRIFNKEREAKPLNQQGIDVRNLRGLFSTLSMDREANQESSVNELLKQDKQAPEELSARNVEGSNTPD